MNLQVQLSIEGSTHRQVTRTDIDPQHPLIRIVDLAQVADHPAEGVGRQHQIAAGPAVQQIVSDDLAASKLGDQLGNLEARSRKVLLSQAGSNV